MTGYIEITIGLLILYLLYDKPPYVTEYANTILGKMVLICTIIYVTARFGKIVGLLSAITMIILMHSSIEGLENDEMSAAIALEDALEAKKVENDDDNNSDDKFESCKVLKEKLENGDIDISAYDARCEDGILKLNAQAATIDASKEYKLPQEMSLPTL